MVKLNFDSGIQEFDLGGEQPLRFNPGDPNVYARFLETLDKVTALEEELVAKGKDIPETDGEAAIRLIAEADAQVKELLNGVFGGGNDFDKIVGVNLMAPGSNGERVITNLFAALTPVLKKGTKAYASGKVAVARGNRAQRRAKK